MNQFQVIGKIGEGAFATVYKAKRKQDGKIYALKKIKIYSANEKQISNALNQVRILASVNNPYIIGYKDAFYEQISGNLCLITQFAQGGDLSSFINSHRKKKIMIQQEQIWKFIIQMLNGLKALHKKNIFHRDIKSANIFMTKNFQQSKLGDMNVSVISKSGMASTQTGTPYYTSPQVWRDMPYNGKCDVWSLGCVIYEMTCFHTPFLANDINSLKKRIINGQYDHIPNGYSEDLQEFIRLCLTINTYDRPSTQTLLHCKYIRKRIHLFPNEKFSNQNYQKLVNSSANKKLLQTIKTPFNKNFKILQSRLPKSNYNTEDSNKENISRNKSSFFKESSQSSKTLERQLILRSDSESKLPRIKSRHSMSERQNQEVREVSRQRKNDRRSPNNYGNLPRPNFNHYR